MWERFFNWQSDRDWAWGPFLPLRPPRDTPIRPWVWGRLFLVFTLLGLLLLGLLVLVCGLLPRMAVRGHPLLPPLVTEAITTLTAMAHDTATQALLLGLFFSLPPLFFLFCLPYHWAWNRRAARLAGQPQEERGETAEVWPPSPKR